MVVFLNKIDMVEDEELVSRGCVGWRGGMGGACMQPACSGAAPPSPNPLSHPTTPLHPPPHPPPPHPTTTG